MRLTETAIPEPYSKYPKALCSRFDTDQVGCRPPAGACRCEGAFLARGTLQCAWAWPDVAGRLSRYQGHVSAALVLGGVDFRGPHLFTVYPHGSTDALPYATMGSGSLNAMAVFEDEYKCAPLQIRRRTASLWLPGWMIGKCGLGG